MIEKLYSSLSVPMGDVNRSFEVPVLIYETVEEGDTYAGKVGAILESANENLVYRGPLADAREMVAEIITEITGEKMATKDSGEKDDNGAPIMELAETEKVFARRMLANNEALFVQVQNELSKRARGYEATDKEGKLVKFPAFAVNIKERERKARKPAKLAQKYIDLATAFLTGDINPAKGRPYDISKFLAAVERDLQTKWSAVQPADNSQEAIEVANKSNVTSLGWLCKRFADHQAEVASNKF